MLASRALGLASIVMALAVSACGTATTSLFPDAAAPSLAAADPLVAGQQQTKISIAPVIGAPEAVAKDFQAQLTAALARRQIAVVDGTGARFTLRGYIVSAAEKSGTKVSYIWDVTDPSGARVNRITGEEIAAAGTGRDPWAAVSPQIIAAIAEKTAGSLATWLPTQTTPAAGPAVAGGGAAAVSPVASAGGTTGTAAQAATAVNTQTTGSINRPGQVTAVVAGVTGAPGDGSVSLAGALQKELTRNGMQLAAASPQSYRINGRVKVGAGANGKQPIQIDWDVKDPQGKNLGTVSQKNEIPEGSLNGAWGKTADAAAAAAAQGILKLIPNATATTAAAAPARTSTN
ncbi:MAG: hypothetical protein NW217_08200 [Hyphomicrobiaceae bacterium]|nr:hypothetical protein [Hyphomicrobiaceae bacterium]